MAAPRTFAQYEIRDGITLFHHRSRKWKTEVVRFVFVDDLDEKTAERALGAYLLRHGHRRLRGMDRVSRFLQDLYGAAFTTYATKTTRRHLLTVRGVAIRSELTPGRLDPLARLVGFLNRVLTQPYVAAPGFEPALFDLERRNLLRAIDAIADNKAQYAEQRLVEEMYAGHALSIPSYGHREDVEAADLAPVVETIRETIETRPLLIYSVGSRSASEVRRLLRSTLELGPRPALGRTRLDLPPIRGRARTVRERQDVTQGRLAMGWRIDGYRRRSDLYPAALADAVFGGYSSSRLFKQVREKHSLAYSVGSSFDPGSGTVFVSAGVDAENVDRAAKMVRQQVRAVAQGRVRAEELAVARAKIAKSLEGLGDSQDSMIHFHLGSHLGVRREAEPEQVARRYARVRPDALAAVFARLKLDTVFVLEGKEGS